ncbi:hypothetical protein [Roseofilum casamattae]|uniref:Uncharacterized protein n=1 Tax=Roseofilum casamattae BLCC-M143 TaxID=3022442 RepID=A0ABT7BZF7_9CYAN|nr:hypothetical protein [Roseofilum casamattae]MDJ1184177.1 hypothetical protein [Roseofilum casamattae BLCC-M143]
MSLSGKFFSRCEITPTFLHCYRSRRSLLVSDRLFLSETATLWLAIAGLTISSGIKPPRWC